MRNKMSRKREEPKEAEEAEEAEEEDVSFDSDDFEDDDEEDPFGEEEEVRTCRMKGHSQTSDKYVVHDGRTD